MQELENRVVVITGAAGSLGSTTATTFAAQGATVVLVDIHRERLEEVQKQLPDGVESSVIETNLLEQSSVDAMAEAVVAKYGTIDMIANIAGGFTMGPPVHETSDRDWDFMMDLNLRSIFHTSRAVIPVMLKNGGGRIVNISARAAREGKAGMGAYCASKAAVITLEAHWMDVIDERDVLIKQLPNEPGALGVFARQLADAGINIEVTYPTANGELANVVDDLEKAKALL